MLQVIGLNGSPALQHINLFFLPQFGVMDELADSAFCLLMEVVNEGLTQFNTITNT